METFFEDLNSKKNYLGEEFEQQIDTKLRTIYICDTIEEDTYKRFCFFFNRLDSSPGEITIHLTSLGGNAYQCIGPGIN
jgi:ATP-dependent protease ClpP protease subunit